MSELRIPEGDSHLRHVCPQCGEIHYQNPKVIVGSIANGNSAFCLPASHRAAPRVMDASGRLHGERRIDDPGCFARDVEEACARVSIEGLFALINIPHISQVHLFYRARLLDTNFGAGEESLETQLFSEDEIPWHELAFSSVDQCLKAYFGDRRTGRFEFHETELPPLSGY
jgi:hypothetical protein